MRDAGSVRLKQHHVLRIRRRPERDCSAGISDGDDCPSTALDDIGRHDETRVRSRKRKRRHLWIAVAPQPYLFCARILDRDERLTAACDTQVGSFRDSQVGLDRAGLRVPDHDAAVGGNGEQVTRR